jgi:hypothetical protein
MKTLNETKLESGVLPYPTQSKPENPSLSQTAMTCPNCGSKLEGRKCKLLCTRAGCGYMVTCSEW